jgi:hypothetical protein
MRDYNKTSINLNSKDDLQKWYNTCKKYQNHCTMVKQYELLYEMWLFGLVVGCHHPHMNISFNLQNFNIFWSGNRIQKR